MTTLELTTVIPGFLALVVGVAEMRRRDVNEQRARCLAVVAIALGLVVFLFLLDRIVDVTASYLPWLARGMAILAMIVGLSGILVRYSRKLNAVLMAVAGFMLAFYWLISIPRA